MEIDTKLLVLMLVFGIIESYSVSAIPLMIFFIDISSILLMYISSFFLPAINIAMNIIIFAVIYSIGKGVNLKAKLKSVVVSLSVGCFLGSLIGYSAYVVIPFFKGASWYSGLRFFSCSGTRTAYVSRDIFRSLLCEFHSLSSSIF